MKSYPKNSFILWLDIGVCVVTALIFALLIILNFGNRNDNMRKYRVKCKMLSGKILTFPSPNLDLIKLPISSKVLFSEEITNRFPKAFCSIKRIAILATSRTSS